METPEDRIILEKGLTPQEAQILMNCLQNAGIEADTGDTSLVQTHALLSIAVGGACVRVRLGQLAEAKEVAAAYRSGAFELPDDFDGNETAA